MADPLSIYSDTELDGERRGVAFRCAQHVRTKEAWPATVPATTRVRRRVNAKMSKAQGDVSFRVQGPAVTGAQEQK
jgi:hypothetical protein